MEDNDLPTMDVLGHVQYLVHAPLTTLKVLEADTAQDPTLLFEDKETTLFPQGEGMQNTQDHQEVLHKSEVLITTACHIPLVMTMLLTGTTMVMVMARNLPMRRKHGRLIGDHNLVECQGRPLDLDLDLLIFHLDAADRVEGKMDVETCILVLGY